MKAVFLDGRSLDRDDLDFSALRAAVSSLDIHAVTPASRVQERIRGYDVVITNKVEINADQLPDAGPRLICVAATGINNIDMPACAAHGITVTNCQGYGTDSVAQHALALMLNLATRMPNYQRAVQHGDWHRSDQFCLLDYPIMELAGKTLGIVGYGTLGQRVAELGRAFGMQIRIAARAGARAETQGGAQEQRVPLEQLLPQVDVLSLHCPLTPATRNLIGRHELALMKPSALLINTARGGLVDEAALVEALQRGQLAGAGLDVVDGEPPDTDAALFHQPVPGLIITPHCGWAAREARQRVVAQLAENIVQWQSGYPVRVVT